MVRDVLERLGPREAQPRLEPVGTVGLSLPLPDLGRTYILGHAPDGGLALDAIDMWREHVALERDELGVTLRPLGPAVGLRVDGTRVEAPTLLRDGAQVTLGDATLRFVDPAESYLRRLEATPDSSVASTPAAARPAKRREWALVAVGIAAVLIGALGLVWVARW